MLMRCMELLGSTISFHRVSGSGNVERLALASIDLYYSTLHTTNSRCNCNWPLSHARCRAQSSHGLLQLLRAPLVLHIAH